MWNDGLVTAVPGSDHVAYVAAGRWQMFLAAPLGIAMLIWWGTRLVAAADPTGWIFFGGYVALSALSAWLTLFKLVWRVTLAGDQVELLMVTGRRIIPVAELRAVRRGRLGLPIIRTSRRWFAVQVRGARELGRFYPVVERLRQLGVDAELA